MVILFAARAVCAIKAVVSRRNVGTLTQFGAAHDPGRAGEEVGSLGAQLFSAKRSLAEEGAPHVSSPLRMHGTRHAKITATSRAHKHPNRNLLRVCTFKLYVPGPTKVPCNAVDRL